MFVAPREFRKNALHALLARDVLILWRRQVQIGIEQGKQGIKMIIRRLATRRENIVERPIVLHASNVPDFATESTAKPPIRLKGVAGGT